MRASEKVEARAVASRDAERARAFAGETGAPVVHATDEATIRDYHRDSHDSDAGPRGPEWVGGDPSSRWMIAMGDCKQRIESNTRLGQTTSDLHLVASN